MTAPLSAATALTVPGYELASQLWQTPRSQVWRGRRTADSETVILKVSNEAAPGPERLGRFRHEFRLLGQIQGDGIPAPLDFEPFGAGALLVLADGGGTACATLLARDGAFSPWEATRVALRVAQILERIHDQGVIHKDVTPSNIVINRAAERVELIDFELASQLGHEAGAVIHPGNLEGTPAYIAPEQTGRMNRDVDYRADFYALGASLFELLAGQPPFPATDRLALVHSHIAVTPPDLTELVPAVPASLAAIVGRLLAKTPEARYQSAAGLAADLAACEAALAAGEAVPAFPPGAYDIPQSLRIPEKLYGREDARATLISGFERAADGQRRATLVTGEPGIGKSALVGELHKPVAAAGGSVIAGKFDQLQRERPYSALVQAVDDLVRQILAASEDELAAWRRAIQGALGANGGVLAQLVPEIVRVIGEQPSPPRLDAEAERNRLTDTLSRFVGALVGPGHPLVLFLDDLHWADTASLNLLRTLLLDPELGYLYVVGAYRDSEVDETHPLRGLIATLANQGAAPAQCHLTGLAEGDVAQLVADTLNAPPARVADLARQAQAKTLGNPFFLERVLARWAEDGVIWPDRQAGQWRWDSQGVAASALADNVIALMTDKLRTLPDATQTGLAMAAILGNQVDLANLSIVAQQAPATLVERLWPALEADLIQPLDTAYKYLAEAGHSGHAWLRFRHDHIQHAALGLLAPAAYRQAQLAAGQLLLAEIADPETDERLFEALGHLNNVTDLLPTAEERDRLIRLNLVAGERAQRAAAYDAADRFLDTGLALLGEAGWRSAPVLTHSLMQRRAESAFMQGDMATMRAQTDGLMAAVAEPAATASALELRIRGHVFEGNPGAGIAEGLQGLAALGLKLPSNPGNATSLGALLKLQRLLKRTDLAAQAERGEMVHARDRAAMVLLAALTAPAYLARPSLFPLLAISQVRLAIQRGNHPSACYGFAAYGLVLMVLGRHVDEALPFARLAQDLLERLDAERYRCSTNFLVSFFIDGWQADLATTCERLLGVYDEGLRTGDPEFAAYAAHCRGIMLPMRALPLSQLEPDLAQAQRQIQKTNQQASADILWVHQQGIHNLYYPLSQPATLNGPYIEAASAAARFRHQGHTTAVFALCHSQLLTAYHFGDLTGLSDWFELAEANASGARGGPEYLRAFPIYLAVRAAYHSEGDGAGDLRARRRCRRDLAHLDRMLAKINNPEAFKPLVELARGEVRRLQRRDGEALAAFEAAVASAEAQGDPHRAGLARERAGRLHEARGRPWLAAAFIQEAMKPYSEWEAYGKIDFLRRRYHALTGRGVGLAGAEHGESGSTTHSATTQDDPGLDLEALVRAAQTISEEIRLAKLAERLMELVGQTAGATHGCLLLGDQEATLQIQAVLDSDREPSVDVLVEKPETAPALCDVVPLAALRYALRRGEALVVDDPAAEPTYGQDPYVTRHRPGAILCVPLVNHGRITGLLYVEHRQAQGAFPASRTELLGLLSAQMAISLENAKLYSDMEAQVAARTRELEELASTDLQTGAWRRHHFLQEAKRSFDHARRTGDALAVIMLDIDRFKTINDIYGHDGGDRVLEAISQVCLATKRSYDSFGRLGGEEFALLLPDTDGGGAVAVAERLRRSVAATELTLARTVGGDASQDRREPVSVTVSVGVASLAPNDEAADSIIQRADEALYQAKNAGRDRVQTAAYEAADKSTTSEVRSL